MSPATLLLTIGAAAAGLGLVALLVGRREPWDVEETPERYRVLRRAYERILRIMKDLEFDHQTGTLSAEEHGALKAEYKEKAIAIRRELERARLAAVRGVVLGRSAAATAGRASAAEAERIEALVARAREKLEAASGRQPTGERPR